MDEHKFALYKCPNHPSKFNNMRLNNEWCDITIRVSGKEFRAHKLILAGSLNYFKTMLSNNSFQESVQGVVTMESLEATDLETFLTYAYTGEILLTDTNALNLLEVANYLSQDDVKEACIEFLEVNLKQEDALRAYTFAKATEILSLKNVAKLSILLNFENFSQNIDYFYFDHNSLMDILSDGKVQSTDSQLMLFEGIMRWIMHDVENRKIHTKSLLSLINISKLADSYLMDYLGRMAHRLDAIFCSTIVTDVMFCHHASKIEQKKHEKELVMVGEINGKICFQTYNFTEKTWSPLQEIPGTLGVIHSNAAILDAKLYYIRKNILGWALQVFDLKTKQNKMLQCSNFILADAALCTCSKYLYLCGGWGNDNSVSDKVLRYDPQTNEFTTLPLMENKRWGAAATFYQGFLHVLGGSTEGLSLASVEKYDPEVKKWTTLPSMRGIHNTRLSVAVLDEKLYACGGRKSNYVEVYYPLAKRWKKVQSMNKWREQCLVVAIEGKLLAVGGIYEKSEMAQGIEVYDPSEKKWQIDYEMSIGLQIQYPVGGIVSGDLVTHPK